MEIMPADSKNFFFKGYMSEYKKAKNNNKLAAYSCLAATGIIGL